LGARNLNDLPAYVDPFIEIWAQEHKRRSSVGRDLKSSVEKFLKIVVPEYTGNSKQRKAPFSNHAPAFSHIYAMKEDLAKFQWRVISCIYGVLKSILPKYHLVIFTTYPL
jgi:hypothetical protein